jgi:hypothetical protein
LELPIIAPKYMNLMKNTLEKKRLEQQRGEDDQKIQQEVRDKMSTLELEEYDSQNMNKEEEHEAKKKNHQQRTRETSVKK